MNLSSTISQPKIRLMILVSVVLLQLSFIAAIVFSNQIILSTGEHVFIRLPQPVDPPSLFRGNYVSLNYTISRIALYEMRETSDRDFKSGDSIWVKIEKNGSWWDAVSVHKDKPRLSSGEAAIKGKVSWSNDASVSVTYGIEQYFIPQKYEKEANQLLSRGRGFNQEERVVVGAEVIVHSSGRARVADVLIGGVSLMDLLTGRASERNIKYEVQRINVQGQDKSCVADSDCVIVTTDCSECSSCGTPVNKIYQQKYANEYFSICQNYTGPMCGGPNMGAIAPCATPYARCISNYCSLSSTRPLSEVLEKRTPIDILPTGDYNTLFDESRFGTYLVDTGTVTYVGYEVTKGFTLSKGQGGSNHLRVDQYTFYFECGVKSEKFSLLEGQTVKVAYNRNQASVPFLNAVDLRDGRRM